MGGEMGNRTKRVLGKGKGRAGKGLRLINLKPMISDRIEGSSGGSTGVPEEGIANDGLKQKLKGLKGQGMDHGKVKSLD